MIIAHYAHRLPANYDIALIHARAKERGVLWDAVPRLYFKAFLLRESGRYGAIANDYSSLYLWQEDDAFRDFLLEGRYKVVTDSFGRAEIATWFALDARKGSATGAQFAVVEESAIAPDTDLTAAFAGEIERNREIAMQPTTVAAVVGIDTRHWKFIRVLISVTVPSRALSGTTYEIVHLAQPLLGTLPDARAR